MRANYASNNRKSDNVKIITTTTTNFIHSCTFHETLKKQLESLNSKGKEVMILGDVNIDFLKYNKDAQTSAYLDMLFDLGFMRVITKATRVTDHTSSLIDHIYTNAPEKVIKSGICLADISDHLPVFCTIANTLPTSNEVRFFRDFTHFNQTAFLIDLSSISSSISKH